MNAPQLPAHLQNKQSRNLAQALVGNLGAGSPPYLSIMGNRFSLIDAVGDEHGVATYDPRLGPYVDCVIVDANEHTSKIFYDKPFDPSAQQYEPPACFSDNGIGPSRNASRPQARTCAECPQGVWGSKVSAVSGKGVKACTDVQKIAIMVPGYEMPFLVRIPPNSRNTFRAYTNKFKGSPDIDDVVTRITFTPGQIGQLSFDAVNYVDEQQYHAIQRLVAAKAMDAIVGRTDLPRVDGLPAPAAPAALPAPVEQTAFSPAATPAPFVTVPMAPPGATGFAPAQQVQQPAPFVPPAAAVGVPPAPMAPQMAAPAPAVQPASPSEPKQRRRRNTAQAQPQPAPGPQTAPFMPQQPAPMAPQASFIAQAPAAVQAAVGQQSAPQAPFAAPAPVQAAPQPDFGIQQGAAPNAQMSQVLDGLFGKPQG